MAKVFKRSNEEKKAIDIIYDTLDVSSTGAVSFRSRTGRGSGGGVEIPGDQFDTFVEYMLTAQKEKSNKEEEQKTVDAFHPNNNPDIEEIIID